MSLSVSNIAFDDSNYDDYIKHLLSIGINNIEIAPYKHFKSWELKEINYDFFKKNNLNIVSTQGTFFNININLFKETEKFIQHFKKIIDINKKLNCKYTVFGSPSVRKLDEHENKKEKYIFFNNIFNLFSNEEMDIGIELNPKIYNCNFFCEIEEIKYLNFSKNIYFHFDTGCLKASGASINKEYENYKHIIKNIHVSEPGLNNLLNNVIDHKEFANILTSNNFNGNISLEMKYENFQTFKKSVDKFINIYKEFL